MKAIEPTPSPSVVSLSVRFGNRVYPGELPKPDTAYQEIPELVPEEAAPDIQVELVHSLWRRLDFASIDDDADHDKDQLIEDYGKSLAQIVGFGKDVQSLFQAVCRANLESRAGKGIQDEVERKAAVGRKLNEMIGKASPGIMPPENALTAELIAQPSEVVYRTLKASLHSSTIEFVKELFSALERLVDKRIAGLIEWPGENLCRYHFFKEVVIHEGVSTEVTVSDSWREDDQWGEQDYRTVTTKRTVENEFRWARHEHHVTHAFHTSIANSRVVVPLNVQGLISQVPAWLVNYVTVVDGSLFRERIVERKYDEEKWTDVQTRDEPIPEMGWEPAVVIGSIVLTGWGPREIDAELARRKEAEATKSASGADSLDRRKRNGWATIAVSAHILSAILMFRAFGDQQGFALPAMALFLLGVWGAIQALTTHASLHRLALGWSQLAVSVGAVTLFPAAVHALIMAAGIQSSDFFLVALGLLAGTGLLGTFAYPGLFPERVPASRSSQ